MLTRIWRLNSVHVNRIITILRTCSRHRPCLHKNHTGTTQGKPNETHLTRQARGKTGSATPAAVGEEAVLAAAAVVGILVPVIKSPAVAVVRLLTSPPPPPLPSSPPLLPPPPSEHPGSSPAVPPVFCGPARGVNTICTERLKMWNLNTIIQSLLLLLFSGLKVVFRQYKVISKDRNARDHLSWTTGNGYPMHRVCIPHRIPSAWEQQEWIKMKKQTQE